MSNPSLSIPTDDFVFKGQTYPSQPQRHPLFRAAREQPGKIDEILQPYLHNEHLPSDLELYLVDYTNTSVTPDILSTTRSPDRPRWYYANSLIFALVLGRAYKLLSTPTRPLLNLSDPKDFPFSRLPTELRLQIWDYYKSDSAQRVRLWHVISHVFIKALFSGNSPEEGSRYITGILLLICGHALSNAPVPVRGYGHQWVWWDSEFAEPDRAWDWEELEQAVMSTALLPRTNTTIPKLRDVYAQWRTAPREEREAKAEGEFNMVYVSQHTLAALDLAREHLRGGERDWTAPEIVAKFLRPLFEALNVAGGVWEATGFVPEVFELDNHFD